PAVKARLLARAAGRLDAEGRLLITADTTRSQSQNLELARERLAELVRAALVVPKKRRPTRPSRGARERRLESKRMVSEKKRARKAEL
ncbi:MAG TPA: aminoacyl-tRNA hydrolase, partial [Polyangiaceae bacterium]